ncbi:hypothetical protein ACVJDU_008591 [Bradyrhizobium diazoefficiens]
MEGAQGTVFGGATIRIVGSGIVADADELDALQAEHAPGFRPAAIVADHHAHDGVGPGRTGPEGGKTEIAIFEIALLQLLVARTRPRLDRARQMHLAIAAENLAVTIDQDGAIVAAAVRRQLGIADIKTDTERTCAVEQLGHRRVGHAALEILVERLALQQPARKERGEGKLREHHEAGAAAGGLLQQREHARERMLTRVCFLRRAHLGGGGAKDTNQDCLQSVRSAASMGE